MRRSKRGGLYEHWAGWLLPAGAFLVVVNFLRLRARDRRQMVTVQAKANGTGRVMDSTPTVSILLAAWNEEDGIDACLRSLVNLRYPHKQIIVCAGGDDDTLAHARAYEGESVVVLEQARGEGKQRALRRCYECTTGDVIYLTDADCVIDDDAFESVIAPIVSGAAVATGAWRPLDRQVHKPFVQFQWAHHVFRELWMPDAASTLDGRNAAVARWALDDVGGFDLDAPIGTDYVLSKMLTVGGHDICFVRGSRVQTEYPESPRAYWKQQSRWFRNPLILGRQWDDRSLVFQTIWIGVSSLGLLLAPLFLLLARSRALVAGWLVVLLHLWLGTLRFGSVLKADLSAPALRPPWPFRFAAYLPISYLAMAKGLLDAMMPRRRSLW